MHTKKITSVLSLMMLIGTANIATAANADEGYYGSVKLLRSSQSAGNMELTSPRVTNRISGPNTENQVSGSFAAGYQFGNGWRTEGEYTLKQSAKFDSYWAPFDANANQYQVSSQRLMLNVYKDFAINQQFSVFGTLGLGLALIDAEGWQGNDTRRFANRTQTNLAYSAGLGMSYAVTPKIKLDLGYRFVDMGNIESGFNTFVNRVSARDEQLKANLKSNEIFLGMRANF